MKSRSRSVVVVGASAAGLRCACRVARLQPGWQVSVVEANPVFAYAACGLPYVVSGDIDDPDALRRSPHGVLRDVRYFAEEKGVAVLAGWRATRIDLAEGRLTIESGPPDGRVAGGARPPGGRDTGGARPPGGRDTGGARPDERRLGFDELVIATGARPRRLPGLGRHPRILEFHDWDDVEPLRSGLRRGLLRRVAVVGAGLVGCEIADALRRLWEAEVILIEQAPTPLPDLLDPEVGACVARRLESNGVRTHFGTPVRGSTPRGDGVVLHLDDREVMVDAVVAAVGVEPEVELARSAGVRLGGTGAIAVDCRLATSQPHVWAAGDCIEVRDAASGLPAFRPFGSLANRQGRTLANVLAGRDDAFPPVAGAVATEVFDYNVAAVGCTETRARSLGLLPRSVWLSAPDCAEYWPEAETIHLKLVYERGSGRVLGVQAVGAGDVVKRIDVATQFVARGATIEELGRVEHAYAPPFAPALEPLAVAAFAALNQEDGVEAAAPGESLEHVLDVRLPEERLRRPAGARRVEEASLVELRNAPQTPRSPELVVCERGPRAAEAARLLLERGRPRYLGGGLAWRTAAGWGAPEGETEESLAHRG